MRRRRCPLPTSVCPSVRQFENGWITVRSLDLLRCPTVLGAAVCASVVTPADKINQINIMMIMMMR